MSEERIEVTLDLYVTIDEDELQEEVGTEKPKIQWSDIKPWIIEQIEEAVKESGNGTSIQFAMAEENTRVRKY